MNRLLMFFVTFLTLYSCASQKKVAYFQDVRPGSEFNYYAGEDIIVETDDMLSIMISSKNPQLAMLFNLPRIQQIAGTDNTSTSINNTRGELSGYTVDSNGHIDFPVLGLVHIAGLTKEEIALKIKSELTTKNLLKDPIVTVSFINLQFSVLGEVKSPGRYNIEKNQTTILEALSMAGDLTIYGERDKVFLTREINSNMITYQLDLKSQNIYTSPAYYVQQGDLIYVEPNKSKANQSSAVGNTIQSPSFWLSVATALTTIAVLFTN